MIAQRYTISNVSTIVTFGDGDIAISGRIASAPCENGNNVDIAVINFTEMKKPQEIGSDVKSKNIVDENSGVGLVFTNVESIDVLLKQLKDIKKQFVSEKKNNSPKFRVHMKNILVSDSFQKSRPLPDKIMQCYESYKTTGNFGKNIFVSPNLVIEDGYVAYLVAEYEKLEEIDVVAPDGITINLNGTVINFKSPNVKINLEKVATDHFMEVNGQRVVASSNGEIQDILAKIKHVFKPIFE